MSETPKWSQFENLVAEIQRELTPDAKIQTNVKREGRRSKTQRQIDILIETKVGQFDVSIIVDCKDYRRHVDIKDVDAFIAMIEDVGATKGAIVSASGFSSGAVKRAKDAGIETYELVSTGDHPWSKLLSIPAVIRDREPRNYGFSFRVTGAGIAIPNQDWRYMKLYRADGHLLGYPLKLLIDRLSARLIPTTPGTHEMQPLSDIETWAESVDGQLFRIDVYARYTVDETIRMGRVPLKRARGFLDHQSGVTYTRGFEIEVLDVSTIGEDWEIVPSLDKLAVTPLTTLIMTRFACPVLDAIT